MNFIRYQVETLIIFYYKLNENILCFQFYLIQISFFLIEWENNFLSYFVDIKIVKHFINLGFILNKKKVNYPIVFQFK